MYSQLLMYGGADRVHVYWRGHCHPADLQIKPRSCQVASIMADQFNKGVLPLQSSRRDP